MIYLKVSVGPMNLIIIFWLKREARGNDLEPELFIHIDFPFCLSAAAAASLCVRVKGAIPSMPERKAVLDLLQEVGTH